MPKLLHRWRCPQDGGNVYREVSTEEAVQVLDEKRGHIYVVPDGIEAADFSTYDCEEHFTVEDDHEKATPFLKFVVTRGFFCRGFHEAEMALRFCLGRLG